MRKAKIMQRVAAKYTAIGQKVSFGSGAWWAVTQELNDGWRLLKRGSQTKRVSPDYPLFQEPFSNLTTLQ